MTFIDFIIGLTMVNGLSHFILGVWGGNMLSGFGFGDTQNKIYGVFNVLVSVFLYVYKVGIDQIFENGIYIGGMIVVLIYFITASFWRDWSNKKRAERRD